MNKSLSIVITCKNAEAYIQYTIESVLPISHDIVLYDTGSTDATLEIAGTYPVKIFSGVWEGFGKSRNRTIAKAQHDWVFVIDADEMVDATLQQELIQLQLSNEYTAYAVRLKNFLGERPLNWGDWGADCRVRLLNKKFVCWDDSIVHEKLLLPDNVRIKKLKGSLHHKNAANLRSYSKKLRLYAFLTAQKYYTEGRQPTWIRRHFSALYTFIRVYFFRLGFLDGWYGFVIAQMIAYYTFLKYARLHELYRQAPTTNKQTPVSISIENEQEN